MAEKQLINVTYIEDLAKQIRNTDDCQALALIVDKHLQSLLDLIDDIIKEQASIIKNIIPILNIPFPDPVSIVKWIKKLVTGTATQQLTALINYTIQLIKLSIVLADLAAAVAERIEALAACGIQLAANSILKVVSTVENSIVAGLSDITTISDKIKIAAPGVAFPNIDTTSREQFLQNAQKLGEEYTRLINEHINQ